MRANEYTERIKLYKRNLIEHIKQMVAPHLYESGFRNRDGSPLRLYALFDEKKQRVIKRRPDGGDFEFCAVTSAGVVTDAYGGGCVVEPFEQVDIENLTFVAEVMEKWFADREQPANER